MLTRLQLDAAKSKKPGTREIARLLQEVFGVVEAYLTRVDLDATDWARFDVQVQQVVHPEALARQIAMAGLALRKLADASYPEPHLRLIVDDVLAHARSGRIHTLHPADFDTVEASFRALEDAYRIP